MQVRNQNHNTLLFSQLLLGSQRLLMCFPTTKENKLFIPVCILLPSHMPWGFSSVVADCLNVLFLEYCLLVFFPLIIISSYVSGALHFYKHQSRYWFSKALHLLWELKGDKVQGICNSNGFFYLCNLVWMICWWIAV